MTAQDPRKNGGLSHGVSPTFKRILGFLKSSTFKGIVVAFGVVVVIALLVWLFKPRLAHPPSIHPPPTQKTPDASVVIGTFITLYGLFIGGFAALAGFVAKEGIKKKGRFVAWRAAAITFLAAATLTDLFRMLDATGDLSIAATDGLTYQALKDDINDFQIYFILNVAVIIFGIVVACLPSGEPDPKGGV